MQVLNEKLADIQGAGAQLVVLSPEIADRARKTATDAGATFPILQDVDSKTAEAYGLLFKLDEVLVPIYRNMLKIGEANGNDRMELPLTATYVIDTDGVIKYAFLDADYTKRAEPSEVVAAVKALGGKSESGAKAGSDSKAGSKAKSGSKSK